MSQSLVFTLLALALVLPLLGAIVLRILAPRLSASQLYSAAGLIFAVALASVLLLARANVSSLQVGGLSLLLPAGVPANAEAASPIPDTPPAANQPAPTSGAPTATRPSGTPTASPTVPPTEAPPTEAPPTEAPPTATPTETPSPVPPTPTPQPAAQRTYVVQPGDTLRGIAQQFDVSVADLLKANNLTPEQADSLRPGQELIIP